jgi:4'-phosphopantetheinyl transferase
MASDGGDRLLSLADDEIHVWFARPGTLAEPAIEQCLSLLSDDERERILRFRFERHRREATVSRALVRSTLARYVDRPARAFRYQLGPHGRPSVDPPCSVFFNATNNPSLVACAVARTEAIGVDVEPLSRADEIVEGARDVFSAPELAALAELPARERRDRALSLWTCKEAYIKAIGLGFDAPVLELVVQFSDGHRPRIRSVFAHNAPRPEEWWLETRDIGGCRIAVAMRCASNVVTVLTRENDDWAR